MNTTDNLQPFLKWAGGKRQLIDEIRRHIPASFGTYYEPFIGAGAVLFALRPEVAVVNDINHELVNCYHVIQDSLDELLEDLQTHSNDKDYYYKLRDLDLTRKYNKLTPVQRASRLIYLNKTCFNGLFRVNSSGHFNVPYGRYKNPKILNEPVLRAVHDYLASHQVTILNTDFEKAVAEANPKDFIYFDPPYDPVSTTSSFTGYSHNGFGKEEQIRLQQVFTRLADKGCYVLLSNSATDFIMDLYRDFSIHVVAATRNINSVATGRGKIAEVLVTNYG